MYSSFTALVIVSSLGVQRIDAQSVPFLPGFEFPEIDGSAVEDTCRIYVIPTSDAPSTTSTTQPTTTTTTTTTGSPITRKPVVTTTQKPTVQSSPWKPVTNAPIRTQPSVKAPITNHHHRASHNLLYYLLVNRRGPVAASQPMGSLGVSSSSDESAAVWRVSSVSSDESSDES